MRTLFSIASTLAIAAGLSSLALLPQSPVTPTPGGQDRPDPKPSSTDIRAKSLRTLHGQLQGLWELIDLEARGQNTFSTEQKAFCLIHGSTLAIEVHMAAFTDKEKGPALLFDSGIYHFEIEEGTTLALNSLIGAFVNVQARVEFRQPNTKRRYQVQMFGNRMVLARDDGLKLTFQRQPETSLARRDIYGREIKEKGAGGKDDGAKDTPKPETPKQEPPKNP